MKLILSKTSSFPSFDEQKSGILTIPSSPMEWSVFIQMGL